MSRQKHIERESVVGRVTEFLRLYTPFNIMQPDELSDLASHSSILYKDRGEAVFKAGDQLHDCIYVVRKGEVHILTNDGTLVDICTEGQIFGARAFMASETYRAGAIAEPEALLIKLPLAPLRQLIAEDPRVMEFFFGDFSSGVALRKRKLSEINQHFKSLKPKNDYQLVFEDSPITELKEPVCCSREIPVQEAARIMRAKGVGSIVIVSSEGYPLGIVTDTDLRNKVVTGEYGIDDPVSEIMTTPVKTVTYGQSVEEYLMEMIVIGAHHLCVTQHGGQEEKLMGVITDHDLLVSRGNNAAVLIKELRKSKTGAARVKLVKRFDAHIRNLVLHDHPILEVARLVRGFNHELLRCIIQEELSALAPLSSDDFCWLALGSTARGEQIIRTDFDSAVVSKTDDPFIREKLIALAERVYEQLIELGYHSDKAGIQANNSQWIMSLAGWKKTFRSWIAEPVEEALLNATIFFDLMPFFGNEILAHELHDFIYNTYRGNQRYTAFLAQNALRNPPPLGFFKNLVLEKGGENKNNFDIKARAMMPLADAARLQSLEYNTMFPSGTTERYKRLREVDPLNATRYEDCAVAYEIFMRMRAQEGLQHQNDGRYIDPAHLTPLEKQMLKKAFEPISVIQHLIKPQ